MKVFQEVTDWAVPNHTYILSDDKSKMYAYVKLGTKTVQEFKKPYRFDTRGRKFVEVPNTFGYVKKEMEEPKPGTEYKVPGSANNVYTVREHLGDWTCTCPASKWQKSECKHIKQIKTQSQKSPA